MTKTEKKSTGKKSYSRKAYLGRYPYNLVSSGNLEKYYQTLTDFEFLTAKINHPEFGVQALIEDYDLIDDAEALNNPKKVKSLKLIQGALRLSAHILVTDKQQLASQLQGRLLHQKTSEEIQALLTQIKQKITTPWLCPLTPSLTPPGGRLLRTLTGHSNSVNAVAVTPNGQQVISASNDDTLKVWNLATGEKLFTLTGHSDSVNAIAVTPNGQQVISASLDSTLKVWNLATGEELFTLTGHSDWVNAVAVTPNGQQVISASRDRTIKVWNLATGEELFTLTGHSYLVNAIAVTPNGQQVISASNDDTLKVWNLATGEELFTLTGHSDWVNAVAVTPNGQQVISASNDGILKVWNLATGEVIATFTGDSPIYSCAVAPDGMTIVVGDSSGKVHFLRLEGMAGE
uniref:PQQ-binding-like beta-propeller repeat protein n=1 Tax=Desmonostoc muscorum LEGE 12446 TaxID=1828758 RepID=A0A8J6ZM29_DESMC